jgi:hypothetical protein
MSDFQTTDVQTTEKKEITDIREQTADKKYQTEESREQKNFRGVFILYFGY